MSIACTCGGGGSAVGCCRSGIRNTSSFEQQHSGTEGAQGCQRSQDKRLIAAPSRNTETLLNTFTLGGMFVSWNLIYSPFLSSVSLISFEDTNGCTVSLPIPSVQCISTQSSDKKSGWAKTQAKPLWWVRLSVLFHSQIYSVILLVVGFYPIAIWG